MLQKRKINIRKCIHPWAPKTLIPPTDNKPQTFNFRIKGFRKNRLLTCINYDLDRMQNKIVYWLGVALVWWWWFFGVFDGRLTKNSFQINKPDQLKDKPKILENFQFFIIRTYLTSTVIIRIMNLSALSMWTCRQIKKPKQFKMRSNILFRNLFCSFQINSMVKW